MAFKMYSNYIPCYFTATPPEGAKDLLLEI